MTAVAAEYPEVALYQPTGTDLPNINVLISIDVETLLDDHRPSQKSDDPTWIGDSDKYISMHTRQGNVGGDQGGSELTVDMSLSDHIRWRETTYSCNHDYSVLLYQYAPYDQDQGVISQPKCYVVQGLQIPLPSMNDPLHPTMQTVNDYFWEATALKKGEQTYRFYFMVVDRTGKQLGYYKWDPHIVVQ
ncbi:inclusion body family protein [Actinophytocola gossypii]|uniref:Inclusion body family protein n=1 Tax=Actinophytocola gossypii TaxID=2812003 RepID=A0ABT2J394_9PSEU|nr:inclusion body family protein [Actinophytocola gossypii]MCT2582315.1 inclusion body family protein [Actinophytocola gossypii]